MWRGAAAALLGLAAACLLRRGFEPRARLLSAAELRRYRGAPGEPGLYLALLGRVFNVERGRKHYGPGGAYSGFAGRDATRAFASGDFSPAGLVDSVSGLSPAELLSIHSWLSFYRDNYEPVAGACPEAGPGSRGGCTAPARRALPACASGARGRPGASLAPPSTATEATWMTLGCSSTRAAIPWPSSACCPRAEPGRGSPALKPCTGVGSSSPAKEAGTISWDL
ncbi:neuferricin isoform 2-T2 [Ammospiza maritima maritima]